MRVELRVRFFTDDPKSYNVIAEIPGTDPALRDQIVLIGGHLDSWHTASGATDNADGAVAALEAMRILRALGASPRRTIRAALWSGEEQGLLGSRAYLAQHFSTPADRDRLAVFLNDDPGSGNDGGAVAPTQPATQPSPVAPPSDPPSSDPGSSTNRCKPHVRCLRAAGSAQMT